MESGNEADPPPGLLDRDNAVALALLEDTREVFETREVARTRASRGAIGPFGARETEAVALRGRFRVPPDQAYPTVAQRLARSGYTALFRRVEGEASIVAVPGTIPVAPRRYAVAAILFVLTLLLVLWTGASFAGEADWPRLYVGWPFAVSLLGILLAHELGHFVAARRVGVPTSLPYFLPFPLSLLGTMGAVIRLQAPPRDRRALLAVAAAGPLAGLVVALPVLVVGLLLSEVRPIPVGEGAYLQEGNSLLYLGIKYLLFGRVLPSDGVDVFLHPVALAAWAGLMITALNLIPGGQLDGGHVAYALLGERAKWLTWAVIAVLLVLSRLWEGWLIWAVMIFVFGRQNAVPLDELTPLRPAEEALCAALLLIFALVFTPLPIQIVG